MQFLQTVFLWVIPFLLVLGVVVTIHELGHFLAAKALGTKIDQFSIGFGRAIAAWTDKSGVQWRIGWAPIGGYVRFAGDENAASIPDAEDLKSMRQELIAQGRGPEINRYFHFKPLWQRAVIVAAGPAANFALAIAIFAAILGTLGERVLPFRAETVLPNSPAAIAGFRPGDRIVAVNGREMTAFSEVVQVIEVRGGVPTTFTVNRDGQILELTATPAWQVKPDPIAGKKTVGAIGIGPAQSPSDYIQVHYGPLEAVVGGARKTVQVLETTIYFLGRMVTGQVSAEQLRGPLGIADVTKKVTTLSAEGAPDLGAKIVGAAFGLVQMVALISVSIGFMNLLPVPVLDGGHLMFYAYEAVARRPLAAKVQAAGYRVGLALVLGLMLFATWNDLQRLNVFNLFGGLFS